MADLAMYRDGHLGGYVQGGDPGTWCPALWTWAVKALRVRSVIDVGCGEGHSTRFFSELGCDVLGVEGCPRAIRDSVIPDRIAAHDYSSGPFVAATPPDLVWSCEFLEHVEEKYLEHILATFAQARVAVLITHAFPGQEDGHHHVNCRPASYWIRHVERLGFACDVALSRQARAITLSDYHGFNHFARSGLVFLRSGDHSPTATGPWAGVAAAARARWKAAAITGGFRLSSAYRHKQRERRARKRAARQARHLVQG